MSDYKPNKIWWRHDDGEIYCDQGYQETKLMDSDFWLFDSDESRQHVDDLFEYEWDARQEAIKFCKKKIHEYETKLQKL